MKTSQEYVWYLGYGSNLSRQRFLCYILGGKPVHGLRNNTGCVNTALPLENKPFKIPHRFYFALPGKKEETHGWRKGGVAFIVPEIEKEKKHWTLGRMWKITKDQYSKIRDQEGRDTYNFEIHPGEKDGSSIYTITNRNILTNILRPSEAYLKTIATGLKETYNMSNENIVEYLITKVGIKENFTREDLLNAID